MSTKASCEGARAAARAAMALFFVAGMAACAVPLAPGYRIVKESREVEFVPGAAPELRIRAELKMLNSGTTDLPFIDIVFPEERTFGREDMHAEMDGREAALSSLPAEDQGELPNALRLTFDPAWQRGQTHELEIEYVFRSPEDSGTRITIGAESFHLGSRGWAPLPQPPKHFMSPYPRRPDKTEYAVRVPAGYSVLARGTPTGTKKKGGEIEYRFRLRESDLAPYVVAGRYVTTENERKAGVVVFWTRQPLKEDPGVAEERIAAAWGTLERNFGPLDKNIREPHVVEAAELESHVERGPGPAAAAFPGGALVNPQALALGANSDEFVEMVSHALAHNWFGDEMYADPDAGLGLTEGLPEYATIVVDEAGEGTARRRQRIQRYLSEYDEAVKRGAEKPLAVTMLYDPPAQRRIGLAKAPLFFAALEDACGPKAMQNGLAHLVTLLRGQEVGYDDLRSALEQASGKNLGEIFRVWLNQKGIPADFRERYED
jgi:hypothetical protein